MVHHLNIYLPAGVGGSGLRYDLSSWLTIQAMVHLAICRLKQLHSIVRMYGGKEEFWDKSWEMPDVELVK
ncbi:MAG: hypothetical protein JRI52_09705 [Deltaproteobacteria bacterium]|nr:hypothetical protein [Deltaproteobacteria bacterium]